MAIVKYFLRFHIYLASWSCIHNIKVFLPVDIMIPMNPWELSSICYNRLSIHLCSIQFNASFFSFPNMVNLVSKIAGKAKFVKCLYLLTDKVTKLIWKTAVFFLFVFLSEDSCIKPEEKISVQKLDH